MKKQNLEIGQHTVHQQHGAKALTDNEEAYDSEQPWEDNKCPSMLRKSVSFLFVFSLFISI